MFLTQTCINYTLSMKLKHRLLTKIESRYPARKTTGFLKQQTEKDVLNYIIIIIKKLLTEPDGSLMDFTTSFQILKTCLQKKLLTVLSLMFGMVTLRMLHISCDKSDEKPLQFNFFKRPYICVVFFYTHKPFFLYFFYTYQKSVYEYQPYLY